MSLRRKSRSDPHEPVPPSDSIADLTEAAASCRACDIWERATRTVFGEGPREAEVMFVGEQPGDKEDRAGHPFVGPAGRILDKALEAAGIDRGKVYVTNIVKHFNSVPRGKLRIHKKPNAAEIAACRPWLDAEIAIVRPKVIVCLGATPAQALIGRSFLVSRQRGALLDWSAGAKITATVHPSSILRAVSEEDRHTAMEALVADLKTIASALPPSALIRHFR